MKKVEYKIVASPIKGFFNKDVPGDLESTLNAQGKDGWKLVNSIMPAVLGGESQSLVLIFMRECE